MTDAYLMGADCIHGVTWYECKECDQGPEEPMVTKTGKVLTDEDVHELADEASTTTLVPNARWWGKSTVAALTAAATVLAISIEYATLDLAKLRDSFNNMPCRLPSPLLATHRRRRHK